MNSVRSGLTLIELLAATLILSAVIATGVEVLLEARSALPQDALERQAWSILERFQAEGATAAPDAGEEGWQYVARDARRWRVRIEYPRTRTLESESEEESDPLELTLAWAMTLVETTNEHGSWQVILECPTPRTPERDETGAPR